SHSATLSLFYSLFFYGFRTLPYLHSFPTRRSSDLLIIMIKCLLDMVIDNELIYYKLNCPINLFNSPTSLVKSVELVEISSIELVDRKSTRLNSSHVSISYAVFCLKKKKNNNKHHNS